MRFFLVAIILSVFLLSSLSVEAKRRRDSENNDNDQPVPTATTEEPSPLPTAVPTQVVIPLNNAYVTEAPMETVKPSKTADTLIKGSVKKSEKNSENTPSRLFLTFVVLSGFGYLLYEYSSFKKLQGFPKNSAGKGLVR